MSTCRTIILTEPSAWWPDGFFCDLCSMRIRVADNQDIIQAEDAKGIVTAMREGSLTNADTNHEYMIGYAQRAVMYDDTDIVATDEESFIKSLVEVGHIKILSS